MNINNFSVHNSLLSIKVTLDPGFKSLDQLHCFKHLVGFTVLTVGLQVGDSRKNHLFFGVLLTDADIGDFLLKG